MLTDKFQVIWVGRAPGSELGKAPGPYAIMGRRGPAEAPDWELQCWGATREEAERFARDANAATPGEVTVPFPQSV